tara:strand:- start:1108 stop:1494 length:387 start_codon:yes stop_codon:yes gene_type:complete
MKLSDYLDAINHSKKPLMDTEDESVEKGYAPFVVNRCLSYFVDTVLYSNYMNQYPHISAKMQFDYLSSSIRKRKRFSKWFKKEESKDIEIIKEMYDYSDAKAKDVMQLLTPEQIKEIDEYLHGHGVRK